MDAKIVSIFDQNKSLWNVSGLNSTDSMIRPNIAGPNLFRSNFNVGINEELLYCRDTSFWDNRDQGTVVTDKGIRVIPDNDKPSEIIEIWWEDIVDVTYKDEVFYFWYSETKEEDTASYIHESYFFKDNISPYNSQQLVGLFRKIVNAAVPQKQPGLIVLEKMDALEENNIQQAYDFGISELGKHEGWDGVIKWKLGYFSYYGLKDFDKAWKWLIEALKSDDITEFHRSHANYWCSNIVYENDPNNPLVREFLFDTAIGDKETQFDDETLLWEKARAEIRGLEEEYFKEENIKSREYKERKLIFPVNNLFELSSISQSQVMPVELNSLFANKNIRFPLTHPQANQLYVAHPYNPNVYLLYDNYEIEILQDKLRELSEIAQSLGATEIDVKVVSSYGSATENRSSLSQSGKIEHWTRTSLGVSQDTNFSNGEEVNFEHMFNRHQTFAPTSTISEPKDTIWLQGEPSWQRLIKQRLEGGLTSHREVIETKSSRVITGSAVNQLKGEIQSIFADLNLNWNKNEESRYSEHNNLVLSVDIKFSTIPTVTQTLPSSMSNSMTPEELEYKEEYEACLADGVIAASERRLLDRLASKLGLSPEQVKRIEEGVDNPLTEEEKEYLEEFRACLADDPELSPSTRRLLNKMARSLGLSEEQVNKLEKFK